MNIHAHKTKFNEQNFCESNLLVLVIFKLMNNVFIDFIKYNTYESKSVLDTLGVNVIIKTFKCIKNNLCPCLLLKVW